MSQQQPHATKMKSQPGFDRVLRAMGYSIEGLKAAYRNEHAFRQEVWAVAPFALIALVAPPFSAWIRALLLGSLLLILIVELLNSAIEANTDHISLEQHPLAKRAKDMGSAAVFLAILNAVIIWACVFWTLYGDMVWRWFT